MLSYTYFDIRRWDIAIEYMTWSKNKKNGWSELLILAKI